MWSSASFISIENLTNSTWKFVIKPNDNFKYTPGQFIQIKIKRFQLVWMNMIFYLKVTGLE